MKVLIIGDGDNYFIKNKIYWLRKKSNIDQIDLFSYPPINSDEESLFDNIYNAFSFSFLTKIRRLRAWVIRFETRRKLKSIPNDYDIIQIHFIYDFWSDFIDILKSKGKKLVVTVWGSDFHRPNNKKLRKLNRIFEASDAITFLTDANKAEFAEKYPKIDVEKFHICKFGSKTIASMKEIITQDRNHTSKNILKLNPNKIVVTIGYNLDPAQRHIKIIKNILNEKEYIKYKEKIQFVFPITYPRNDNYKKKILNILKTSGFDFVVFDQFLNDERIAHLRFASDIMIQLQTDDVLSSSMLEHIFARNIIITGAWLPYSELIEKGIYLHQIKNIEDIGEKLIEILDNYEKEKENCIKNTELMGDYENWEREILSWINLYETIYSEK